VAAIIKYLRGYGKASTAYNDLRPFVERLSYVDRKQLLNKLRNSNIFSELENTGDEKYPTKEDVGLFPC